MERIKAIDGSGEDFYLDTEDFDAFMEEHTTYYPGGSTFIVGIPNTLHQLLVVVSRHVKILKNGNIRWQKSVIRPETQAVSKPDNKNRLVHFIIQDQATGLFYAEACRGNEILDVIQFLYRAWSEKWQIDTEGMPESGKEKKFFGMPEYLMVSRKTLVCFPGIARACKALDIPLGLPVSGFQSGISLLRNWERTILSYARDGLDFDLFSEIFPFASQALSPVFENEFVQKVGWNIQKNEGQ